MCYISMNREDGKASLEIVHETEATDHAKRDEWNCPRCVNLALDIEEARQAMEDVELVPEDEDDCSFSETIRY